MIQNNQNPSTCKVIPINTIIKTHQTLFAQLLQNCGKIDFAALAGLTADQKIERRHYVIITIEHILRIARNGQTDMRMHNNQVYLFNGAFWETVSNQMLKHFLGKAAVKFGVPKYDAKHFMFYEDLFKQFAIASYTPFTTKTNDEVLINLQNGTFVITPTKQELRPFKKDDFLTYQLPFEYNEHADAPMFDKYLAHVLPEGQARAVLAEFASSVFVKRQTLKLEKALILFGPGSNGKSVFFEVLIALLGRMNVTNYSLQSLTDEKGYYRAQLENKLLNYAPEISTRMNTTLFKQMVSGEPVEARLPGRAPIILEDYAKLIFNTNVLPKDIEQTEAFFRRFIIMRFDVTISDSQKDPELSKKITETELPGVFNWVLAGLKRLLSQKKFSASQFVDEALQSFKQESDTIHLFLTDEGFHSCNAASIKLNEFYATYKQYCHVFGYKTLSNKAFTEGLRQRGFSTVRRNSGYFVYAEKIAA